LFYRVASKNKVRALKTIRHEKALEIYYKLAISVCLLAVMSLSVSIATNYTKGITFDKNIFLLQNSYIHIKNV